MHAKGGADGTGGGIFALRRPRPYSRAFARMPLCTALRSKRRPLLSPPCAYHPCPTC